MIGGTDLFIPWQDTSGGRSAIVRVLRARWPDALVDRANADGAPTSLSLADVASLGDEFFVYEDDAAYASWAEHGATTENADKMIHVVCEPHALTCVVDGEVTETLAKDIRLALQRAAPSAQAAFSPMVSDLFFPGLNGSVPLIEVAP